MLLSLKVDGMDKWTYDVVASPSVKNPNGNQNFIALGIEAGLEPNLVSENDGTIYDACVGEPTLGVGIGDCLRQWAKMNPNFDNGREQISFYTKPSQKVSPMPMAVKAGSDQENGKIIGPVTSTAALVQNTFFIDQTSDGRYIAVTLDSEGNYLSATTCSNPENTGYCDNYPDNFVPISEVVELDSSYFCIPPSLQHPENSSLVLNGTEVFLHCGYIEFETPDTSVQFSNRGTCRVISGRLYCY